MRQTLKDWINKKEEVGALLVIASAAGLNETLNTLRSWIHTHTNWVRVGLGAPERGVKRLNRCTGGVPI